MAGICVAVLAGVLLKVGVEPLRAAGAGLVHLVREPWSRPANQPVAAEAPPPLPADALAGLPEDMRAALIRTDWQGGVPFRFQLGVGPDAICRQLADKGLANSGWAPLGRGPGHECLSDLVPVPGSKPVARPVDPEAAAEDGQEPEMLPPTPSTLFFAARGRGPDVLDVIRFKLNLDDPSVDAAGRALLIERLDDLSAPLSWPLPPAVAKAIRQHRKLTATVGGITVEVHPETGPVQRVNVVLLLRRPAARLPADRFVSLPPMPPELLPATERPTPATLVRPPWETSVTPAETLPGAE